MTKHKTSLLAEEPCLSWRDKPYLRLQNVADILCCSRSTVYARVHQGTLTAVTLSGVTMITTESLVRYLEDVKPWTPVSSRITPAVAAIMQKAEKRRAKAEQAA